MREVMKSIQQMVAIFSTTDFFFVFKKRLQSVENYYFSSVLYTLTYNDYTHTLANNYINIQIQLEVRHINILNCPRVAAA